MKKILFSLLLIAAILGASVACAPAVTPVEGLVYESLGDGTCKLVSGTASNAYDLTVPTHSPEGDRVVAIGEGAFRGAKNLTRLTLPEGIEVIGKDAFLVAPRPRGEEFSQGEIAACAENDEVEGRHGIPFGDGFGPQRVLGDGIHGYSDSRTGLCAAG